MNDVSDHNDDATSDEDVQTVPSTDSDPFRTNGETARSLMSGEMMSYQKLGASWCIPQSQQQHGIGVGASLYYSAQKDDAETETSKSSFATESANVEDVSTSDLDIVAKSQTSIDDTNLHDQVVLEDIVENREESWGDCDATYQSSSDSPIGTLNDVSRRLGTSWCDEISSTSQVDENITDYVVTDSTNSSVNVGVCSRRTLQRRDSNTEERSKTNGKSLEKLDSKTEQFAAEVVENNKKSMSGMQWQKSVQSTSNPNGTSEARFAFPLNLGLVENNNNANTRRHSAQNQKYGENSVCGSKSYFDASTITSKGPMYSTDINTFKEKTKFTVSKEETPTISIKKKETKRSYPLWFLYTVILLSILIAVAIVSATVCGLGYCSSINDSSLSTSNQAAIDPESIPLQQLRKKLPMTVPTTAPFHDEPILLFAAPISETNPPTIAPLAVLTEPMSISSNQPTRSAFPVVTEIPTHPPSLMPSLIPTIAPSVAPSNQPSVIPTQKPSMVPTLLFSSVPTFVPIVVPTNSPTTIPTRESVISTRPNRVGTFAPVRTLNHWWCLGCHE